MACNGKSPPFWKLTEAQSVALVKCSPLAIRLWLTVLWAHTDARLGVWATSLKGVARSYTDVTDSRPSRDRIREALRELEDAGLIRLRWGTQGKNVVLTGLSCSPSGHNTVQGASDGDPMGARGPQTETSWGLRRRPLRGGKGPQTETPVPQKEDFKKREEGAPPARLDPGGRASGAPKKGLRVNVAAMMEEQGATWFDPALWKEAEDKELQKELAWFPREQRHRLRRAIKGSEEARQLALRAIAEPDLRKQQDLWQRAERLDPEPERGQQSLFAEEQMLGGSEHQGDTGKE